MSFLILQLLLYFLTVLNVIFLAIDTSVFRILHWIDFTILFILTLLSINKQPTDDPEAIEIALPFTNFMLLIIVGVVNTLVPYISKEPHPAWVFSFVFLIIFAFMAERHYDLYNENRKVSVTNVKG